MTRTAFSFIAVACLAVLAFVLPCGQPGLLAQNHSDLALLETSFQKKVRPLLARYCFDCHSGVDSEAEIDLAYFVSLAEVGTRAEQWQKVREVLESEQMPPADSLQPDLLEHKLLREWARDWLKNEAISRSGDPGPVILRRLSNAEYNNTVQDLTEIDSLHPAAEFPVDGAAGEGFTNTGSSQGMSPSLVTKYLDAARDVAQHAVLLPDGFRFSRFDTRRDHTDELLARIQAFYGRFADGGGGSAVDLQGIQLETNQGGLLPVERYLRALVQNREVLVIGQRTIRDVADDHGLSERYLRRLFQILDDLSPDSGSLYLADVRARWAIATVDDVPAIVATIEAMQRSLWKFNTVGQIGRAGGPNSWMEPVSPVVSGMALSLPLKPDNERDAVFYLTARHFGDSGIPSQVEWQRPRLEFSDGRAPIPLKDVGSVARQVETAIATETRRTSEYLGAIRTLHETSGAIEVVARAGNLSPERLAAWADYLALGPEGRKVGGHLNEPILRVNGQEDINGWGSPNTPSLLTNRSNETIAFSTLTLSPRSVFVHPSPSLESVVVWRSPANTTVTVRGVVADADGTCGNGIHWKVHCQSERGLSVIAQGVVDNSSRQEFAPGDRVQVRAGDLISLVVNARDQSHVCDTTLVDMTVVEVGGEKRIWNLSGDIVDQVLQGNPARDSYGNTDIWHFCTRSSGGESLSGIPPESILADWRKAVIGSRPKDELEHLANSVQRLLTEPPDGAIHQADSELAHQLLDWNGPLHWLSGIQPDNSPVRSSYGLEPSRFGTGPDGSKLDEANFCLPAPHVLEVRVPWQLATGATFATHGVLKSGTAGNGQGSGGCVQLQVMTSRPDSHGMDWSAPILSDDGPSRDRLEKSMQQFRDLFPAALCYTRIVPVDEVVTLTLYYREDDQLRSLMLDDEQISELDRMWDELYFVSQEPLSLTTVFEQISEFATQDRPDLVESLAPMRQPIYERAGEFQSRLVQAEPGHVLAAEQFASRAWRRPLSDDERLGIGRLYLELRELELPHDDAIRLVLARVLTSPAFLFRLEQAGSGVEPEPISDFELATRLSYFLWSSPPDQELREIARAGVLAELRHANLGIAPDTHPVPEHSVLLNQTRRMLGDARTRQLAIHFACQWLHVRDFDQNDDKNEKAFPEFATLRSDMYEETVLFFEDMFRNDGAILDLVAADHTFVNESLARHYGIDDVKGPGWQKVDGLKSGGRGGVLGMATVLASQSGASRTSPILRGNWVSETLLGERLPRPPPNIPLLPETLPDGLTARQLIELHSSQPGCAKCHSRMDPYGFALEQFDAIGRLRPEPADTSARLADGTPIDGMAGMIEHLSTTRRDDVVRNFCRKLLGYALGREVLLSDEPLLDEMQNRLRENGYRFSVAVETIVTSPQFLKIRGRAFDLSTD